MSAFPAADIFHDGATLEAGTDWPDEIRAALDQSAVFLALIDENWATVQRGHRLRLDIENDWVRAELEHALANDVPVIPVMIGDARLPGDRAELPKCLHGLYDKQALELRDGAGKEDEDLARIAKAVERFLPQSAKTPPMEAAPVSARHDDGLVPVDEAVEMAFSVARDPDELFTLGWTKYTDGNYGLAERLFLKTEAVYAQQKGDDNERTLAVRGDLARALLAQGKTAEAASTFERLLKALARTLGPEHEMTLVARHNHAVAVNNEGKPVEAARLFEAILKARIRVHGPEHKWTNRTRMRLARACFEKGDIDRARTLLADIPDDAADSKKPERRGQVALLRARLADADGDAARAEDLLSEADAHTLYLPDAHYVRRELALYRKTRTPGQAGGTTFWTVRGDG